MAKDALGIIQEQVEILRRSGGIENRPRREQVKYLAKLLGIKRETLAMAMILENPGITVKRVSELLGITERMVYMMPRICSALRMQRAREYDSAVRADEL